MAREKTQLEIRHRFQESGAEWAIMSDGSYKVLRAGDLVPDLDPPMRVQLKIKGLQHRNGDLQTLLPGWGPSPRPVIAVVRLDVSGMIKDPYVKAPACPIRHYRSNEVEPEKG